MSNPHDLRFPQSAVIPIIEQDGKVMVVLITSSQSARWGIPKGLIEPHLSPQDSAANEAWEEAGLRGDVVDQPVGNYQYEKWGGICDVAVYLMQVETILHDYPEKAYRERKLVDLEQACQLVANADQSRMIDQLTDNEIVRKLIDRS